MIVDDLFAVGNVKPQKCIFYNVRDVLDSFKTATECIMFMQKFTK